MKAVSCAASQAAAADVDAEDSYLPAAAATEKGVEASGAAAAAATVDAEAHADAGDSSLPSAASTEKPVEASGNPDVDADGEAGHSSLPSVCDAVSSTTSTKSTKDKPAAVTEPPLTAEELLNVTERARCLVEARLVYAVQEVNGKKWHSLITLDLGRLHLHSLQNESAPRNGHTLQMSELVPVAPPCEVFMDVLCPGTEIRRVILSLPRDNPFGRQFLLLCSGQRGVSYADTCIFNVWRKDKKGESVYGGDYESDNGMRGAALLPDLYKSDQYWSSCKAGSIWPAGYGESQAAQFGIVTKECNPGEDYPFIYGEVVRGLEVFQEAATFKTLNAVPVIITQCGVLISQKLETQTPNTHSLK